MRCPVCDSDIKAADKRRSVPQIRRYFALIRAAFHHWPESHEFQPEDPTHLRKWLQIGAGFCEHTDVRMDWGDDQPGLTKMAALLIESALKAADGYGFARPHPNGGWARVYKSKSIAFHELDHLAACDLFDRVAEIITREIGIPADQLLKETEAAA